MKIVTILGARPQFIKAGTVSREIAKKELITEIIVHTGQHYDANMSDVFFTEMKIPKPHYNLNINGLSHGAMTGQMLEKIEEVLLHEKPDWVLVYGDTNSTLAGALAASKLHIKVAHIEAGLRSFNNEMPEETNRILTDRMSSLLFCPTDLAMKNLKKEGYDQFDCQLIKAGDVMQDGAIFYKQLATKPNIELEESYVLCTIHRAENTDNIERLKNIIDALNEISLSTQVIVPLHPRTKAIIDKHKIQTKFKIIDPVGYLQMVYLINNSQMIMTDSGGLQKEAFFFEKPCITLRDETEWQELVEHNYNVLAGACKDTIISLFDSHQFNNAYHIDLYGSGFASKSIVCELMEFK
jgi:UDP-GlcNAc3NAcA epimerase